MTTATLPRTEAQLTYAIGVALGFRHPGLDLRADENPACVSVWSVRELQDVYARVGGTVTARPVTRRDSDGTYTSTEVVLTVELPDLGTAAIVTDWNPADEAHGWTLPVIQAIAPTARA